MSVERTIITLVVRTCTRLRDPSRVGRFECTRFEVRD